MATSWTRRTFMAITSATVAAHSLHALEQKSGNGSSHRWVFVGSTAIGDEEGIHVGEWNSADGTISNMRLAFPCRQPSFQITAHAANGAMLFSCHQPTDDKAAMSSFRVMPNGDLHLVNTIDVSDQPESFIQLVLDRTHHTLISPSYRTSFVRSFHIAADGTLSQPVSEYKLTGSGPNQKRQEAAHAHGAVVSPENKFVLVNDLGSDKIMVYHLDAASSKLTPNMPAFFHAKPGSGPRHTAFHPNGKWAYAINELDSTITTMSWDAHTGTLTSVDSISTVVSGTDLSKNRAGEVIFDKDGKFLYACNRGAPDELVVFTVGADGKLSLASRTPLDGKEARHFALSPDGGYLVVAEQSTNFVSVFKRDHASGALTKTEHKYPVNKASCIMFA